MNDTLFADEHYHQKDFREIELPLGTYENCRFTSCQLAGLDWSIFRFTECRSEDCDLSNVTLTDS